MPVMRDMVDVREFGPAGVGATIQAAENWASSVSGGSIYIPQGDWVATATLTKSPRTVWHGSGNRFIASATASKAVAATRIVGQTNGPIVQVVGLGADTIKQRGLIEGINIANSSEATYPAAICVEITNDVQEHMFLNVLCSGGAFGFKATSPLETGSALYFTRCYQAGATNTGIHIEDITDCWMTECQFSGAVYGGNIINAHGLSSNGTRWQVSETNLRLEATSFANLSGGHCDTGTGIGMHIIDCIATRVDGYTFYSNGGGAGDAHIVLESTTGNALTNTYLDVTCYRGSNPSHLTPIGVKSIKAGTTAGVSVGGDLRGTDTPLSGDFGTEFAVRSGTLGVPGAGVTASRPTLVHAGFTYFDTTLGKLIAYNGSAWVNADGSAL